MIGLNAAWLAGIRENSFAQCRITRYLTYKLAKLYSDEIGFLIAHRFPLPFPIRAS